MSFLNAAITFPLGVYEFEIELLFFIQSLGLKLLASFLMFPCILGKIPSL